jgi:hypothetical protein
MNDEAIDRFEQLEEQLEALYDEIGLLSKRKPDDAVSKFKLSFINNLVRRANEILGNEYVPFEDFQEFDPDAVPTTSDVVLVLGQYLRGTHKLRVDLTSSYGERYFWYRDKVDSDGSKSSRQARAPRKGYFK